MVEEGFIQKLDVSRHPEPPEHQREVQEAVVGPDRRVPRPEGLRHDRDPVPRQDSSRIRRSRGRSSTTYVKGEGSGKTVFVDSMGDVMVFPLKMKGYSLNSVDQEELEEARQVLLDVAPHILALDSDKYGDKLASEEATVALGWTGPLFQVLATAETEGRRLRRAERGLAVLARHLGHARRRAASEHLVRVARLHPSARRPGQGDELQRVRARPATRPRRSSTRQSSPTPRSSRPTRSSRSSKAPQDTSGNNQRHRHLGGVQAEDRRLTAA